MPRLPTAPVRRVALATWGAILTITVIVPGEANASGFALNEMSAGSIGNANAGAAALADDATTLFYNPAGLMRFSGRQLSITGTAVRPKIEFNNRGSFSAAGTPMTGGNGGDAGSWAGIPALFFAGDLAPNLRFGLGIHAPFGLKTEYDAGWAGRYQALKSELKTINLNPTLAYRLNPAWSVGAGISAQYADVTLTRAIDFGSACVGVLGAATCVPRGFVPQARDGKATVDGNDWGVGFNLGALYEPNHLTRIGLTYRSKIHHRLSGGNARYELPAGLPAVLANAPSFTETGVTANLDLPESVSLSGYQDVDANWSLMADVSWMRWSRLKELRIRFNNGAPDSVTPENWKNTMRVGVAANYRYTDRLKLRAGLAWDESPVRDASRTARIPDADRTWLALGARYTLSPQSSVDIGYAHLFMKDSSINKTEPPIGGTLTGDYDSNVNILSLQYNQAF